jgi:hypothetical protein
MRNVQTRVPCLPNRQNSPATFGSGPSGLACALVFGGWQVSYQRKMLLKQGANSILAVAKRRAALLIGVYRVQHLCR